MERWDWTGDEKKEGVRRSFMTALIALTRPAEEQVRESWPGCVECELYEDFVLYLRVFREWWTVPDEKDAALDAVMRAVDDAVEQNHDCSDITLVERPAWDTVRAEAEAALRVLGWEGIEMTHFEWVQPSVLHRRNVDPGERR